MNTITKMLSVILGGLVLSGPAYAYLDPNSGSILLQIFLGGFAGVALALRMSWGNLKSFFSWRNRKNVETEEVPEEGQK